MQKKKEDGGTSLLQESGKKKDIDPTNLCSPISKAEKEERGD